MVFFHSQREKWKFLIQACLVFIGQIIPISLIKLTFHVNEIYIFHKIENLLFQSVYLLEYLSKLLTKQESPEIRSMLSISQLHLIECRKNCV